MVPTFFDQAPSLTILFFLFVAVAAALAFECVNGFHDAASAVAAVIYTRSLKPWMAVLYAGVFNFLGVLLSDGAVAYSIVNLFPVALLMGLTPWHESLAMVFSVLLTALLWNLSTWYLGIPTSSSHTMVGSILGVTIGHAVVHHISLATGVQWNRAGGVAAVLLVSPMISFFFAVALNRVVRQLVRDPELYKEPVGEKPPPWWIRTWLILTCGGVSLAHGSNDGQKGMGLLMVILLGLCPASFAMDLAAGPDRVAAMSTSCGRSRNVLAESLDPTRPALDDAGAIPVLEQYLMSRQETPLVRPALIRALDVVERDLSGHRSMLELAGPTRGEVRTYSLLASRSLNLLPDSGASAQLRETRNMLQREGEYVLPWVKLAVALALGIGTAVGWKRVVVTIGEKIGQNNLTYAQGAVAQTVTMSTIMLADSCGMPVSTTHILSSAVAGSMAGPRGGLQTRTLVAIASCWVLTIPVSMSLSCTLFLALSKL